MRSSTKAVLLGLAAVSASASADIAMQSLQLETEVGALSANLYLPEQSDNAPVVIVTGAWTSVKEQMPAVYAKALAAQGYAALTFDFRGWGQSPNGIRFLEDPSRKANDIAAVIDAVSKLSGIDSSRIAGLGICASAGYMLDAVAANPNVSAVAVVAPWLHDRALATAIYGGEQKVSELLAAAEDAEGHGVYIEAASNSNPQALMYQVPYYTETNRGLIAEYDNQFNVASWQGWLTYDAMQSASKLTQPLLMVASESMALPAGTHQYLQLAGNNADAIWLEGVSQFDFYDQPDAVANAVAAVVQHFDNNL